MPPSILNAIEGGGQCAVISKKFFVIPATADRFPYAGMIRFRFTGYDLSPERIRDTPNLWLIEPKGTVV